MPRVKRGVAHVKRRKNLLKKAKGFMWGRKSKPKLARVAVLKAGKHAYEHRRTKKRDMRAFWIIKINAGLGNFGLSYARFIDLLKKKNVVIDRKILADLAEKNPKIFKAIVKLVK
jgi:large subunit ribosomal protein L20